MGYRQAIKALGCLAAVLALPIATLAWQAASAATPDSYMFRGGAERLGVATTTGVEQPGFLKWVVQTAGVVRSSPVVAGALLYIGSGDGHLYALERETGRVRWRFAADSPIDSTAAVAAGRVFFASRAGSIYGLKATTGKLLWKVETGEPLPFEWGYEGWDYYSSSPAVVRGVVLVGSRDGHIYALAERTGARRWRFQTGGRVSSSPAVAADTVYCGDAAGSLQALDLATGKPLWRFDTTGRALQSAIFGYDRKTLQATPSVAEGVVYIGSRDGVFYAVDARLGTLRWQAASGTSWVVSSAAVADGLVFSSRSDQHYINALRADTGAEVWRLTTPTRSPVFASPFVVGDTLYIGCAGGRLYAIDKTTGVWSWQYALGAPIYSSPLVADGVIYVGDDSGAVYALAMTTGASPRRAVFWDQQFADWMAILPAHREARHCFERWGYEVLDSQGLARFMEQRLADSTPSVIVFAMDVLPHSVAPHASATTLFRRYLDSGGKIVWMGNPPFFYSRDETGKITAADRRAPGKLLGVDHGRLNFDLWGIRVTAAGKRWGLAGWWTGTPGVDPRQVQTTLALDDTGGAVAWVQGYGGAPGTGFVQLWGLTTPIGAEQLAQARAVAEYGITRRADNH